MTELRGSVALVLALGVGSLQAPATRAGIDVKTPVAETPQGPAVKERPDVEIRSGVDRTAVWIGDHVRFTVDVECAPRIEILTDDLAAEKLKLKGLEIVSTDTERTPLPSGGVAYRFVYELVTYDVGLSDLTVDDLSVRYYTRQTEQRPDKVVPSGEAKVTGVMLAWRSTLPAMAPPDAVRDQRRGSDLPAALAFVRPVGIGLLMVSAMPVGVWLAAWLWRVKPQHRRSRARETEHATREALDALQAADVAGESARKQAYGRLDALLRAHITATTGVSASSLTAREIDERLDRNDSRLSAGAVRRLLGECEQARYAPPGQMPSAERFREALTGARQFVPDPERGGLRSWFR